MTSAPWGYDIFLSHNHADKEWVRELAGRLADADFNGRRLRPWLDEHFLDPGALGSEDELTTAIDRSRFLGLVVSPEALASKWVDLELRHFLQSRGAAAAVAILRRDCILPAELQELAPLDFREGHDSLDALLALLAPRGDATLAGVAPAVEAAFARISSDHGAGFSPEVTQERDEFLDELLRYDIADPAEEGLAVAAFLRAAEQLRRLRGQGIGPAYDCKMLLGECLAVAVHRHGGYRQVAQRYLDMTEREPDAPPVLLFVVARAFSKLAELDPRLVDTSALLRAISRLDAIEAVSDEIAAIELLFGRVVAKLRDTPAGELLIKTLAGGGRASRIAAAGGIGVTDQRSGAVYYLTELKRLSAATPAIPVAPPSRRLLGELMDLDLDQHESVTRVVRALRAELQSAYPGIDFPYGHFWPIRREPLLPAAAHNTPFAGTLVKVTLKNMVERSAGLEVSTVACLSEPRIVDALFDRCGALLILQQDPESPQCRRLRDRHVPFAMLTPEFMAGLADGEHVVVHDGSLRVMKG